MDENQAVTSLAALAHEQRLRTFRLLVRKGPSGMPAGEIADAVGCTPTGASFHLKELDHAGLSTRRAMVASSVTPSTLKECVGFWTTSRKTAARGSPNSAAPSSRKSVPFVKVRDEQNERTTSA